MGGQWSFVIALNLMIVSMLISLHQLQISVGALDLLEDKRRSDRHV